MSQKETTPTEQPTNAIVVPVGLPMIHVQDPHGGGISFKLKPTTPFRKMFDAYCERYQININNIRFLFDGNRLAETQTMQSVGMVDGDVIDAVVQQTGGGI